MNKLIKSVMTMAFAGAMLCIVGCGNSPESVSKSLISCIKNADMKGASKYATGDLKEQLVRLAEEEASAENNDMLKAIFKKYEISQATIDGDSARVTIKFTPEGAGSNSEQEIKLSKVDGVWKVVRFDFL
ncbi:MAG: DUF4878 domain-containing protein [Kiritimatiellia bacterium]